MAYRYRELYEIVRDRIQSGEFALGERIPSIAQLQEQYGISSPNTVRAAHDLLVRDGFIRTEQGRGAFVLSTESARNIDPLVALDAAAAELARARKALTAGAAEKVTIDLADDRVYFVVTDALSTWAAQQRHEAATYEPGAEPDSTRTAWAETAERLLSQIDETLGSKSAPSSS